MPRGHRRSHRRRSSPYPRLHQTPTRSNTVTTSSHVEELNLADQIRDRRFAQRIGRRRRSRRARRLRNPQDSNLRVQTVPEQCQPKRISSRPIRRNSTSTNAQRETKSSTSGTKNTAGLKAVYLHRNPNFKTDDDKSSCSAVTTVSKDCVPVGENNSTLTKEKLSDPVESRSMAKDHSKSSKQTILKALEKEKASSEESRSMAKDHSKSSKQTILKALEKERASSEQTKRSKSSEPKHEELQPPQVSGNIDSESDY